MKLFPYKKNIDVGIYFMENDLIPKFMEKDIVKVNENKFGCPAVGSLNNRMYEVNSMFDLEIEFGLKDNEPYFNYNFPTDTYKDIMEIHKILNYKISTMKSDDKTLTLQIISEFVFVTDDKDLEIITMPSMSNLQTENCRYVSGTYYPYAWLRNLNASWLLLDNNKPGYIKLSMEKPMMTFLFNKPINLKAIKPTEQILEYQKYMNEIVTYRNKINKIFPHILSKRPKKLL